ncbi:MAG: tyrosine-protein phosphatase [Alphaproteobacteria bacterium]|nr:tyrosine-protein phosphatase [Alphaproteobacteria bacterium]
MHTVKRCRWAGLFFICVSLTRPAAALVTDASVERLEASRLALHWQATNVVDVFMADRPDASVASSKPVSRNNGSGAVTVAVDGNARYYFIIRDRGDGSIVRTAERLVRLDQGSNFRDIGGYPAAGGKHVRWGLIYRSGATAMLSISDLERIRALGLQQIVDLRSSEERVYAPTKINGVAYSAVGYSMQEILDALASGGTVHNAEDLYRILPSLLAPQLHILFSDLLRKDAPIEFNCSAGQDRTGFATAMVLSALGTPRNVIVQDYALSTTYRQPQFEMPPIDATAHPGDPVVAMFARSANAARKPQPLLDPQGRPFLLAAFEEIDRRWGSPEAYLQQVIGLSSIDIAELRAIYLE